MGVMRETITAGEQHEDAFPDLALRMSGKHRPYLCIDLPLYLVRAVASELATGAKKSLPSAAIRRA